MSEQKAQARHLAAKRAQLAKDTPANRAVLVVAAGELAQEQGRPVADAAALAAARALLAAIDINQTTPTTEAAAYLKAAEHAFVKADKAAAKAAAKDAREADKEARMADKAAEENE